MARILLLSHTFPPENTPAAVRPGQLFRYLPRFGYEPLVVTASVPGARAGLATDAASWLLEKYQRYAAPYNDRLPWVPQAIAEAEHLIRKEPVKAIFSTSPFLSGHIAALWLVKKYQLPWIADFQDPILDNPARRRNWVYPYDALLERAFFSNAYHLLANTNTVAAAWAARYPQWKQKISIFWNSFDPEETMPAPADRGGQQRTITHVGSFYEERRPTQFLKAVGQLVESGRLDPANLRIRFVGPVDVSAEEQQVADCLRGLGMLEYNATRVPRSEALQETVDSDYLLLIDMARTAFQLPSKLIDYIRAGRPILAFALPESPVAHVLSNAAVPHVNISPRASLDDACRGILEFLRLPDARYAANDWFMETFHCVNQAGALAGLLDGALRKI
jgi:glycosyltransferase involved in cell wall biosynthesis